MIQVLLYIINLFAPLVNMLGLIGLCGCVAFGDFNILVIAGIMAIVGLVLGIFAYGYDIPPRWFWSESRNEIFSFVIMTVIGYAGSLAMWPCAIYFIKLLVNAASNAS